MEFFFILILLILFLLLYDSLFVNTKKSDR